MKKYIRTLGIFLILVVIFILSFIIFTKYKENTVVVKTSIENVKASNNEGITLNKNNDSNEKKQSKYGITKERASDAASIEKLINKIKDKTGAKSYAD